MRSLYSKEEPNYTYLITTAHCNDTNNIATYRPIVDLLPTLPGINSLTGFGFVFCLRYSELAWATVAQSAEVLEMVFKLPNIRQLYLQGMESETQPKVKKSLLAAFDDPHTPVKELVNVPVCPLPLQDLHLRHAGLNSKDLSNILSGCIAAKSLRRLSVSANESCSMEFIAKELRDVWPFLTDLTLGTRQDRDHSAFSHGAGPIFDQLRQVKRLSIQFEHYSIEPTFFDSLVAAPDVARATIERIDLSPIMPITQKRLTVKECTVWRAYFTAALLPSLKVLACPSFNTDLSVSKMSREGLTVVKLDDESSCEWF